MDRGRLVRSLPDQLDVHPAQITAWKDQLLAGTASGLGIGALPTPSST
jgi:hypothetical protein